MKETVISSVILAAAFPCTICGKKSTRTIYVDSETLTAHFCLYCIGEMVGEARKALVVA